MSQVETSERPATGGDVPAGGWDVPAPDSARARVAEAARALGLTSARHAGSAGRAVPSGPAVPSGHAVPSGPAVHSGSAAHAVQAAHLPVPGTPAEPRPRHLRVVEAPKLTPAQRRRRARAILFGIVGVAVAVAFGLVYLHVVLAQRQFELDQVTAQVQRQQATYQRLRLQVAELGSPQHVISTAEGQLGMRQPARVTYLTPKAAASTGSTGTAAGASRPAQGSAPAGDADWPQIKSQLAGSP